MGQALQPRAVRMIFEVEAVDTFYGETQALFGVIAGGGARQGVCAARPQRRRQDHDAALDPGAHASAARRHPVRRPRGHPHSPTHEIARAGIGWVPDDRRLCPTLTVARNLGIAQKRTRFRGWTIKGDLRNLLAARISDGARMRKPVGRRNADGGDRARAGRCARPDPVRRAEPGLAPKIVGDVLATIRRLREEGVASLVVEQNAEIALSVADHAAVIDRGRIAWTGEAASAASTTAACASACSEFTDGFAAACSGSAFARSTRAGASVRHPTFTLEADLEIDQPAIVGVVGPERAPARPRCSR